MVFYIASQGCFQIFRLHAERCLDEQHTAKWLSRDGTMPAFKVLFLLMLTIINIPIATIIY